MSPSSGSNQSASSSSKATTHNRLKAIGLILLTLTCFALLDTTAKFVATERGIPVSQAIWLRFVSQFALIVLLVPAFGFMSARELFQTKQLPAQLLRSLLMALTTAFNFLALLYLRLDQTVTIFFLAPLVVALIAGPVLGEWVGWRRLAAIIVGFLGIVIAVRPGIADIHPAIGFSFAAMAAYVWFMLITRRIAGDDPPLVTLNYSLIVGAILGAPFALFDWVTPSDMTTWVLLLLLGVFGGIGHYLFIIAHRLAPASILAPFVYFQILAMITLGYFVFGDLPDIWTLTGAGIVVGSGLYLFHRERMTKQSDA